MSLSGRRSLTSSSASGGKVTEPLCGKEVSIIRDDILGEKVKSSYPLIRN